MGWKRRLVLALVAIVGIYVLFKVSVAVAATAYAGTLPPMITLESTSMMHVNGSEYDGNVGDMRAEDVPFGRIGTLDPGDLAVVKARSDPANIETYAEAGEEHHGAPGEVLVYHPDGDRGRTSIIHRAMTYVEVNDTSGGPTTYEVRWHEDWNRSVGCATASDTNCTEPGDCGEDERGRTTCTFDHGFRLPALLRGSGTHVYRPETSGFITQGDNVATNVGPDQAIPGFDRAPVEADGIRGVARAEVPWVGLTELATEAQPAVTADLQEHPYTWTVGAMTAPRDLWISAFAVTGLWWSVWLGGLYLAYRYARYDELPWRASEEPDKVGFDPVAPGDPGQRS